MTPDDWHTLREVRLAALQDSPDAFWATYEGEVEQPESWWRNFVAAAGFLVAFEGEKRLGIAALIDASDLSEGTLRLISMWVAPRGRGRGVGRQLVEKVIEQARNQGAAAIQLEVAEGNDSARQLYERCGFRATGVTTPLPRDRSIVEHEMLLWL